MKLVSVTMSNKRDTQIVDALRSVIDHVDQCIVVGTHPGHDYDYAVERDVCGDKLIIAEIDPITCAADTARARNQCVEIAAAHGADWCLILDTDERMHWREGQDVRAVLDNQDVDCLIIRAQEAFYSKDKFLRPGTGSFQGEAHEAWVPNDMGRRILLCPGPSFSELPKDPKALRRRDRGVIRTLKAQLKTDPDNPRAHFYLGQSYLSFGALKSAERHFLRCAGSRDQRWSEEAGWACYKVGHLRFARGELDLAARAFTAALGICPTLAEAAYWNAHVAATQQRPQETIAWCSMAIAGGCYEGLHNTYRRMHFRDPQYLWEGPYELLRAVYSAIGQPEFARESVRRFRDAYNRRIAEDGGIELDPSDWRLHQDDPPEVDSVKSGVAA